MKRAFITGITGQDGSYLAEFLLGKGYEVWGLRRRSSSFNADRIEHIYRDPQDSTSRFHMVYGDMTDGSSLRKIVHDIQPDEVYNLAGQSHVQTSFEIPEYTFETVATGTLRLLEVVRDLKRGTRFYQASSSEMFGNAESPQTKNTPFLPVSPYGVAKLAAHNLVDVYRRVHHMFVVGGILFNHESPRRGETFVTRKITRAAARIKLGLQDKLYMGNLEAKRDWGFAGEYVQAMWMMLQAPKPYDYVVATGEMASVRQFVEAAFSCAGLHWQDHVVIDPRYYRPTEVHYLCGDASEIRQDLNWKPAVSWSQLVRMMVDSDMKLAIRELAARTTTKK